MEIAVQNWSGLYRHPSGWSVDFEPLSLSDMFDRAANATPDASLIDFYGRKFSYARVAGVVSRIATGLAEAGIRPGDRVGLYLPNVPHYVAAYYGALRLGAVVVNFSPLCSIDELRCQLEDSGTRLLFTLSSADLLPKALELLDSSPLERLVVGSTVGGLPLGRRITHRLFRRRPLAWPRDDARISPFEALIDNDGTVPKVGIDAVADVALLQYSDGTTGKRKGAMLTHQALSANARQINAADPSSEVNAGGKPDRIIGVLPLFHIFANACVLNRTVADGGEMVLLPHFDPGEVIAAVQRTQATSLPGVPAMFQALLDHPGLDKAQLSSLRFCISGGAPLPQQLKQRFEQRTGGLLVEGYGLTEAGIVSSNPIGAASKPGAVGQPLASTHVALVHRDHPDRDPLPGEPGEIIVSGPQVMRGYWRDRGPSPFVDRGSRRWLRTGDIGTIDPDGYLRVVDRLADMISVGGVKVFPSQMEAMLYRHPAVQGAMVIGVSNAYSGQLPKAFVTMVDNATTTPGELKSWFNARVGKHEQLVGVEFRGSLPLTPAGKQDRRALIHEEEASALSFGPPPAEATAPSSVSRGA